MPLYQHKFENVEDYLHHRQPYLLVDRIVSIGPTEVVTEKDVIGTEGYLEGHFPGAPIFPGAMMQELTTQSGGILIAANFNPMSEFDTHDPHFNESALGVLVRVDQAKYRGFARPGETLRVHATLNDHIENMFDFRATISSNGNVIMSNRFRLANIASKTLIGD